VQHIAGGETGAVQIVLNSLPVEGNETVLPRVLSVGGVYDGFSRADQKRVSGPQMMLAVVYIVGAPACGDVVDHINIPNRRTKGNAGAAGVGSAVA